jgi:superfamily II DNA/RNA helicase
VLQKQYYRAIFENNREFLYKGVTSGNLPNLLNLVMQLRKVCNHPFLVKGVEDREMPLEAYRDPALLNQYLIRASGKLVLLDKLLPKLKKDGHKVLIFSQLKGVLDLIERYLRFMGFLYERLDGGVKANDRQASIDRFCKPDSDRFVFLLSTRAGGQGINLAVADTVIIFDSDWNPQNDVQAQARCHRIGQKKDVKVYRLISRNTYEKYMFERASKKLGLDQVVLHNMRAVAAQAMADSKQKPTALDASGALMPETSESPAPGGPKDETIKAKALSTIGMALSKEEIQGLLKYGAYDLFRDEKDSDKASATFCEQDIEDILEHRSSRVVWKGDTEGSTFAKATFQLAGESTVDVDAPDFWEKILPAAATSKMLLDQFSKIVTSKDEEEKQQWVSERKATFIRNLGTLVEELIKAYNDAKGVIPVERDTLASVLQLCSGMRELFTKTERDEIQRWSTEIDFSRRRRKSTLSNGTALQQPPPAATSTSPGSARSREHESLSESESESSKEDASPPPPTSMSRRASRYAPSSAAKRKRGRPPKAASSAKAAADSDFEAEVGDSEPETIKTSKKRQGGQHAPGEWTVGEKRMLMDAVFLVGRPLFEVIRERAHLTHKPLEEIQDAVLEFLAQLSTRASDPAEDIAFNQFKDYFVSSLPLGKRTRRRKSTAATLGADAAPAIDMAQSAGVAMAVQGGLDAEVSILIDKRLKGWARRLAMLEPIRVEVEAAEAAGRRPLEGALGSARVVAPWWQPERHDADLFIGIYRHGWGSWDAIIKDPALSFSTTLAAKIAAHQAKEAASDNEERTAKRRATEAAVTAAGDDDDEQPRAGTLYAFVGWPSKRALEAYIRGLLKELERVRGIITGHASTGSVVSAAASNSEPRSKSRAKGRNRGGSARSRRKLVVVPVAAATATDSDEPDDDSNESGDGDEDESS